MGRSYAWHYGAARVACPYYQGEDAGTVRCEGVGHSSVTVLHWRGAQRKRAHMDEHCRSIEGCERCPVYQMIAKKYQDGA